MCLDYRLSGKEIRGERCCYYIQPFFTILLLLSVKIKAMTDRQPDEETQKRILFDSLRCKNSSIFPSEISIILITKLLQYIAFDLLSIRGILQSNIALLTAKMHGYEGTDVYEVIQNVCINYTNVYNFAASI